MNKELNCPGNKISSSALGYAISFLLLVGMICMGLLFISSANKRLEQHYSISEHLIFNNYFSLKYGAGKERECVLNLIHPSGDSSKVTIKEWGFFRVVHSRTSHGSRSEVKVALVADAHNENNPVIYLPENNQTLKVGGETRVEGEAFLPIKGLERAYLAAKSYNGTELIYGNQKRSEKFLPPLSPSVKNLTLETFYSNSDKSNFIEKDSVYDFDRKTSLISTLDPLVIEHNLSGNVVIHSFDSILVRSTAHLNNVILIAPKIRFESGFKGSVQAIAHKQLIVEKNVFLQYPSVLVLNELETSINSKKSLIQINEKSKVLGGILLVSQFPDVKNPIQLSMKNALIAGIIYNEGRSELIGTVEGSVYTNQFFLNIGGGEYINHIFDLKISSEKLPKDFIIPQFLSLTSKSQPVILSCF